MNPSTKKHYHSHHKHKLKHVSGSSSGKVNRINRKDRCEQRWNAMLERLKIYREEHGDCLVPLKYSGDPKLGMWVHTQRRQEEFLSVARIDKLDELGFVWRVCHQFWETMFHRLVKYKANFGDCLVPNKWPDDPQLGSWVRNQRGNVSKLTMEQKTRLNSIGFTWEIRVCPGWDVMFQRLREYKDQHNGSCLVPTRHTEDQQLSTWVETQRQSYTKGRLNQHQINLLDSIGFVWHVYSDWDTMFRRLLEFKREHGHCNVPVRCKQDPKLGKWVSNQRHRRTHKPLVSQEHITRLDSIGFKWDMRSVQQKEKQEGKQRQELQEKQERKQRQELQEVQEGHERQEKHKPHTPQGKIHHLQSQPRLTPV